jgi:hypothetical protein
VATRWEALFADLETQAAALDIAERAVEVEERTRIEVGRLRLIDRLRPAVGAAVRLRCSGDERVAGRLARVGPDWLLVLDEAGGEAVVVTAAVLSVSGVGRLSAVPESESVVESRLGLRHALRGIARDRSPVRISVFDGTTIDGTIDRLGADFVELAEHPTGELRRRDQVRDVALVPLSAVTVVRRRPI